MALHGECERLFFAEQPKQRDIALRLDEAFDITYGDKHERLYFWLAKPKANAVQRFGIQQEVLVIYSPFDKTDARVLTAIDFISQMQQFRLRIDKLLFLLIHNGDQKEAQALRSPDRIIVPFQAEELLGVSRGSLLVRTRIAEAIGPMDLFGMSSPIKSDKYLFGRDELIQTLIDRLRFRKENSGLFGLRKTGKTSVLFAIMRRISDPAAVIEYMDCQNPGLHGARWWQVLHMIATRCLKHVNDKNITIAGSYTQADAGLQFLNDIRRILERGKFDQIAIMLDEVEYITHGLSGALGQHWDSDFVPLWQTIRSVHQETQGQFCFVVAGVNPACVEKSHFGVTPNPIFQLAQPQYLEPLSVSQVRTMVRMIGKYAGLSFEEPVYAHICSIYGGHPYLIRVACSEIWKNSDVLNPQQTTQVSVAQFEKNRDRINIRLRQPIRDILLSLVWWYPEEYDVLRILASGDKTFVEDYLRERPEGLIQFAKYGILRNDGNFAMADIQEFLNTYGESYKKEISPFTRTDMPPSLLPEIPDLDKLGKLFLKRCEIEISLRRILLLYLGVKHSWVPEKIAQSMLRGIQKRSDRLQPTDLFVGRTPQQVANELYTLDLKSIIAENWETFANLFDSNKARFEMNMDSINKARRIDSHTKPITTSEMDEFENSYQWVANRLAKVPIQ